MPWSCPAALLQVLRTRPDDEVRRTREDAAAACVPAGGADRDVGELGAELRDLRQATISTMNAMRGDITDLRDEVRLGSASVQVGLNRVDQAFAEVDRKFEEIGGRLDTAGAGQAQIAAMVQTLIDRES